MSPFDSAHFKALQEGLEVTIVSRSLLERTFRLDAEYYRPHYLGNEALLDELPCEFLTELTYVSDGNHFAIKDEFVEEGVPYFRGQDVTDTFFADAKTPIGITQEAFYRSYMRRSHLRKGDVLLTIVGTIGSTALVNFNDAATCSCKLAILRPHSIVAGYLAAYLHSSYGQDRIRQLTRGALQKGLLLEDMDQIRVPRFDLLEERIERTIGLAYRLQLASANVIFRAETKLIEALGLEGWNPPEALSYVSSSVTIHAAGRLDAQFYQPAKFETLDRLSALPGGKVEDSFDLIKELVDPRKEPDALCRNYDVTDALQPILDSTKPTSTLSEIESQKVRLRDGDLAMSRLRAYLKEIAIVRVEDDVPSIGSSEFYVLRRKQGLKAPSPETLMIYLRSAPVQIILKWSQDGSQHPRFASKALMSLPLPRAVVKLDDQLTSAVQEALKTRRRSTSLIKTAKRAVELAVEEGEASAIQYLAKHGGES